MRWSTLEGQRVAILGFGHEGQAAYRAFRKRFPTQGVTLLCAEVEADAARAFNDPHLHIDTQPLTDMSLRQADVVIKSPGISPYAAPIPEAIAAGVHFTSGSALWFAEHRNANTIAITGTKGKSTTAALTAHLLRAGGARTALVGNIGLPLLDLPEDDSVAAYVIELSSFQTQDFAGTPRVALITNLIEEHLDWHGSAAQYVSDKLRILGDRHTTVAVLNSGDALLRSLAPSPTDRWFGQTTGWHVAADAICLGTQRVLPLASLPLPGLHNALNLCGALTAIDAAGFDALALVAHATTFRPLPHRLQTLGTRDGITYINDSIATTPQAAIAALEHVRDQAVAILVGGHDRGLDWHAFADHVAQHPPRAIVTMGANGPRIADLLSASGSAHLVHRAEQLADAFAIARSLLGDDGVLLLSPGAPSFGPFRDYVARGRAFSELAGFDPCAIAAIDGLGIA